MIRIGSLFTGIAGLDRGVEQALAQLGQSSRVEWQAEKDPYARAVLRKHYPTTPCFEDVRDVDDRAPTIDLLGGGFPCQDLSLAGKRVGITGARSGLWTENVRIIRVLRPQLIYVENVPELAAYLGHVLGPLAELGFDAEWGLFSAAQVGAPHRRERMFILAYARGYRFPDPQQQVAGFSEASAGPRNDGGAEYVPSADGVRLAGGVAGGVATEVAAAARPVFLANPHRERELQPQGREQGQRGRSRNGGEALADPMQPRRPRAEDGSHERRPGPAIGGAWTLPDISDGCRRGWFGGDQPAGAGWWEAEPNVGRVVDGVSSRLDARRRRARLRCLGNGVVAEQAAHAFVTLARRAGLVQEAA